MSAMQRTKGQSGERELAALLSKLTGHDVRRRVRQHDGDSDLDGIPRWSIECKRHATATPGKVFDWWCQACDQARAAYLLPVLFYRADRGQWRAVWQADLHTGVSPLRPDYFYTLEADPETWWQMVRASPLEIRKP